MVNDDGIGFPRLTVQTANEVCAKYDVTFAQEVYFDEQTGECCAVGGLVLAVKGLLWLEENYIGTVVEAGDGLAKELGVPVGYVHGLEDAFEGWQSEEFRNDPYYSIGYGDGKAVLALVPQEATA